MDQQQPATFPRIEKILTQLSPWVTLVENRVEAFPGAEPQSYHSLDQADYINIVCEMSDGTIPLVRQFRPAMGAVTLELPGGIADRRDDYRDIVVAELWEEAGVAPREEVMPLGTLVPDTGRLENRAHFFYTKNAEAGTGWQPEAGVERVFFSKPEVLRAIMAGEFVHSIHIAALFLADRKHGLFRGL